ncbi:MAG: ribosomal RNA small subunit methyltransferase A [Euryarchaeota archaeon]|nr:ribosomal RNA small subunit methyltransferase A [Euryarchaeota archaeon]MDE1837757.1 ribosomal RNA small subunit methyltransferase A [Euryarchaeota archaeon]MDE1881135.1 ribosomal RNA small subunit methyltransferase A [Euryarchaeota archaeon]MDE2045421.1 ribosomal RNA small subunit methyltransferase A [Thermoplasmata archaeon]
MRGAVPSTPEEVASVLELLGIAPSRGLGQSFLIDPSVAAREAALLDLPPGSEVVEVGGGLGQLTHALVERGFRVTVIERDPKLAAYLSVNFGERVKVVEGDARTAQLPRTDAFVGNLPFSAGHEILGRLIDAGMEHGAFLLQKEVAERLSSPPGSRSYGRPTILFRTQGEFLMAGTVPSSAFHPMPAVQGALVVWGRDPIEPPVKDRARLELLLDASFAQRRKVLARTLPAALAYRFRLSVDEVPSLLEKAAWRTGWARRRAEEITPQEYVALANLLPAPRTATPRAR